MADSKGMCWFCHEGAGDHPERKFFVGAGTTICSKCVAMLHALVDSEPDPDVPRSHEAALARTSDEQLLATLRNYAATAVAADAALTAAVKVRRGRGIGWDRIASALGTTEEAAVGRFGE